MSSTMGPHHKPEVGAAYPVWSTPLPVVSHLSWSCFKKCNSSMWTGLTSNIFVRIVAVVSVLSKIKDRKIYMNCWEKKEQWASIPGVWNQTWYLHPNSETLKLMRHFLVEEVFFHMFCFFTGAWFTSAYIVYSHTDYTRQNSISSPAASRAIHKVGCHFLDKITK